MLGINEGSRNDVVRSKLDCRHQYASWIISDSNKNRFIDDATNGAFQARLENDGISNSPNERSTLNIDEQSKDGTTGTTSLRSMQASKKEGKTMQQMVLS